MNLFKKKKKKKNEREPIDLKGWCKKIAGSAKELARNDLVFLLYNKCANYHNSWMFRMSITVDVHVQLGSKVMEFIVKVRVVA